MFAKASIAGIGPSNQLIRQLTLPSTSLIDNTDRDLCDFVYLTLRLLPPQIATGSQPSLDRQSPDMTAAFRNKRRVALAKKLQQDKTNSIDDICKTLKISRRIMYRHLKWNDGSRDSRETGG